MIINGVEVNKPIDEMTDEELDALIAAWAAVNERFVGFRMREDKREAIERLRAAGRVLADRFRGVELVEEEPDHRERHAYVRLRLPLLCYAPDRRALEPLDEFLRTADSAALSAAGGEHILLTGIIHDIWAECGEVLENEYRRG